MNAKDPDSATKRQTILWCRFEGRPSRVSAGIAARSVFEDEATAVEVALGLRKESLEERQARLAKRFEYTKAGEQDPAEIGRLGGKSRSEWKVRAARLNGKLGGRPRKNPA